MVIGFSCRVSGHIPTVVGVCIRGTGDDAVGTIVIDHRAARYTSWADAIALIAGEVETLLRQEGPSAVVIKTLEDRTPTGAPRVTEATRLRLQVEGALLVVCQRAAVGSIEVLTGQDIGRRMGTDKARVEQRAGSLLTDTRAVVVEAAAAALAAVADTAD